MSHDEELDPAAESGHVIICSTNGVGCSGQLRLLLTWRSQQQLHPDINADLTLDPLQVILHFLVSLYATLGDLTS